MTTRARVPWGPANPVHCASCEEGGGGGEGFDPVHGAGVDEAVLATDPLGAA